MKHLSEEIQTSGGDERDNKYTKKVRTNTNQKLGKYKQIQNMKLKKYKQVVAGGGAGERRHLPRFHRCGFVPTPTTRLFLLVNVIVNVNIVIHIIATPTTRLFLIVNIINIVISCRYGLQQKCPHPPQDSSLSMLSSLSSLT